MSETKWTPGPWICDGRTVYALAPTGRWRKGVEEMANRLDCRVQTSACLASANELEADARLMAAAPELHEALTDALDQLEEHAENCGMSRQIIAASWPKLRAALAKARGEA